MEGFSLRRALISLPWGEEWDQRVQDVLRRMAYIQLGLFFDGPRQVKLLYSVHERIVAVDDIGNCRIWQETRTLANVHASCDKLLTLEPASLLVHRQYIKNTSEQQRYQPIRLGRWIVY